jgi:hypothetical protein
MNNRTLLALIVLVSGMFVFQQVNKGARRSSPLPKAVRTSPQHNQHSEALTEADPSIVETPLVHASFRPLNFALLRGGFSSVNEFFERVHDDPVLHSFYGDCSDRNASMHALPEDITAFSTFRKGERIAWAQKPLLVKKGEYVMTFCGKTVLARCGNLISVSPMQPSEDVPPAVLEAPSEPVEAPLTLVASAAPAPVIPVGAAAVPAAAANSHGFFFVPPFYIPPGGSHSTPRLASVVPPPTTVVPPPTTGGPPPPVTTPPPITSVPPPPPSGPPPPPPGHISGDEFSGHQAFLTLLIGFFVIGLLRLTTR